MENPEPYEAQADPQPNIYQLVCILCGEQLDPADCCSGGEKGCKNDAVPREKRKPDTLEWHVYTFARAEPWTVASELPKVDVKHRPEPTA
jgi:hypothetical protein